MKPIQPSHAETQQTQTMDSDKSQKSLGQPETQEIQNMDSEESQKNF